MWSDFGRVTLWSLEEEELEGGRVEWSDEGRDSPDARGQQISKGHSSVSSSSHDVRKGFFRPHTGEFNLDLSNALAFTEGLTTAAVLTHNHTVIKTACVHTLQNYIVWN